MCVCVMCSTVPHRSLRSDPARCSCAARLHANASERHERWELRDPTLVATLAALAAGGGGEWVPSASASPKSPAESRFASHIVPKTESVVTSGGAHSRWCPASMHHAQNNRRTFCWRVPTATIRVRNMVADTLVSSAPPTHLARCAKLGGAVLFHLRGGQACAQTRCELRCRSSPARCLRMFLRRPLEGDMDLCRSLECMKAPALSGPTRAHRSPQNNRRRTAVDPTAGHSQIRLLPASPPGQRLAKGRASTAVGGRGEAGSRRSPQPGGRLAPCQPLFLHHKRALPTRKSLASEARPAPSGARRCGAPASLRGLEAGGDNLGAHARASPPACEDDVCVKDQGVPRGRHRASKWAATSRLRTKRN